MVPHGLIVNLHRAMADEYCESLRRMLHVGANVSALSRSSIGRSRSRAV